MAIFNSLGSNYNLDYVLKSLSSVGSDKDLAKLDRFISDKYEGKSFLFYKGREALSVALKIANLPEDTEIAINGFTCVAVFNTIRKAGHEPVCLDLEEAGGLNFTPETLSKTIARNKKIRAVIVQNTLGYPCEINEIQQICKDHNLLLIEDLAHCVGTRYKDGREAGTVGDFVVLSFSQDKIIDAVSGGALVIHNKKYSESNTLFELKKRRLTLKDKLYPHLTYKIRSLYRLGLGKPYHYLVKKMKLLSNIMDESFYNFYSLPGWNAMLTLYMFGSLSKQLDHRRKIAKLYLGLLPESLFMYDRKRTLEDVELSSNLRFPIFVERRDSLLRVLQKNGVYLADIWYKDVAPDCPNAVADSKIILNLPTHINVSQSEARRIVNIINQWIQK